MDTVDVKFIGGAMAGITLALETNEFQDGDLLNFKGDTYLMRMGRGYFVSLFDYCFQGKIPGGHLKAGHLKAAPLG